MGFLKTLFRDGSKAKTELFTPPPPPSGDAVARAELALSINFPTSFVSFMREAGPMQLPPCAHFYWAGDDIIAANRREREEAGSPLPSFMVAFYNDGMGNQVCFDTRHRSAAGEYPIVFWDHELEAGQNLEASGRTSAHPESAGIIASSFAEWFRAQREKSA